MIFSSIREGSAIFRLPATIGPILTFLAGLALAVGAAIQPRFPGDLAVTQWAQSFATPALDTIMEAVTILGDTPVVAGTLVTAVIALGIARRWHDAAAFLAIAALEGLVQVAKLIVDRPRPPDDLVRVMDTYASPGFPSGHVYHAVVFGGLLMVLVLPGIRQQWLRRGLGSLILTAVVMVMVSRVYLGVHWPSDVAGSVLFGVPSVALLFYLRDRFKKRNAPPGGKIPPSGDGVVN